MPEPRYPCSVARNLSSSSGHARLVSSLGAPPKLQPVQLGTSDVGDGPCMFDPAEFVGRRLRLGASKRVNRATNHGLTLADPSGPPAVHG
jgi:hypothetical protein